MAHGLRVSESAAAPVVGAIVLVAVAIVGGIGLYVALQPAASDEPIPVAVGVSHPGWTSEETREFTITSATPGLRWERLAFTLDDERLAYDGDLAGAGSYCVVADGDACAPTAGFSGSALVDAGERVRLRDAVPSGKTVRVLDVEANLVLAEIRLA